MTQQVAQLVRAPWAEYFETLASEVGGQLLTARPQVRNSGGRASFFVDIATAAATRNLYVRAGRDMIPDENAHAQLAEEKLVMDWLAARDIPIARAVHLSPHPPALAMEAIAGEDDFLKARDRQGETVLAQYFEVLARMHSLDITELSAGGMYAPTAGVDVPLHHWKSFVLATYAMGGTPLNPFCTWIESWMERHAPAYDGPLSLIQGDTGPGNFIFDGDHLGGLVDWELAHLGDPMEDLGALRLRDIWTPFPGGVRRYFDQYEAHSGRAVDIQAVRWYSIKLCVLHAFVLAIPAYYPQVSATPAEWLAEYYSLPRLGVEEMATYSAIELGTPELPEPRETLQSRYHDSLTEALSGEVLDAITDPFQRYRAEQAWRTASYLRGAERYLEPIENVEVDEIADITKRRAATHEEALADLDAFIRQAGPDADEQLMRFFYGQLWRREALWPGAIGRSEHKSFTPLD